MTICDLSDKHCVPCEGGVAPLADDELRKMMADLHEGWTLDPNGEKITRRMEFKGFAKAMLHANLAAFIGDQEGHHPDIAFGWGYCDVTFSTHAIGGLSENDFICAAKFDRMVNKG